MALVVFLLAVGGFTVAAAVWDSRFRRIPNNLTLPMFLAGLIFQAAFNGWQGDGTLAGAGLKSGLLGFLLGFGTLFVLWLTGGSAAGDAKLMGALSVWLGFEMTFKVLIASAVVVLLAGLGAMVFGVLGHGVRKIQRKHPAAAPDDSSEKSPRTETLEQKHQRRIMAYAVPVAVATWSVVLWGLRA